MKSLLLLCLSCLLLLSLHFCSKPYNQVQASANQYYKWEEFVMGSDLSYINEIEDFGGSYKENNVARDVYDIFKQHGNNCVRVRLWHNPTWLIPVTGGKLYSDIYDVEKTIRRAKAAGMSINLNLHYSDDWADPAKQPTPAAWKDLPLEILKDSVYRYTFGVLTYLKEKNLTPEMIQIGNENNNGMLWPLGKTDTDSGWYRFGVLVNSGIKAVRDFSLTSPIKPQVIIHVAQLQYADAWTSNITQKGKVLDYDILGLSHYYKWSTVHSLADVGSIIKMLKSKYGKKIMVVETAFPWTQENADRYNNLFFGDSVISGFAVSKEGQLKYLETLTQQIITNGGSGIMYWEPAWISSPMKDRWGTGSSWENATFFDFNGNLLPGIDYMRKKYKFP